MSRMAHPAAMQPSRPGPTRTAAPHMPAKFPTGGRYLSYIAFGATSFVYLYAALMVLRVAWALGAGEEAWGRLLAGFANPIYVAFHAAVFVVLVWAGQRFLIKLAGKANPPKIGPLRRPPLSVFPPLMAVLWIGASLVALVVLWGIFP